MKRVLCAILLVMAIVTITPRKVVGMPIKIVSKAVKSTIEVAKKGTEATFKVVSKATEAIIGTKNTAEEQQK